jgi:hypothetical protein
MENYIPKITDTVTTTLHGHGGRFVVTRIDKERETADLQSLADSERETYFLLSVTWKAILFSDPSQSTPRIA